MDESKTKKPIESFGEYAQQYEKLEHEIADHKEAAVEYGDAVSHLKTLSWMQKHERNFREAAQNDHQSKSALEKFNKSKQGKQEKKQQLKALRNSNPTHAKRFDKMRGEGRFQELDKHIQEADKRKGKVGGMLEKYTKDAASTITQNKGKKATKPPKEKTNKR